MSNTGEAGDALVRLRLTHVPADDALRALLMGTGLGARQTGPVVTAAPVSGLARPAVLTGLGTPSGKTISLVGKKRVDTALERIGQAAGWSLQLDTEDAGDDLLVLDLRAVPVEQALAAVLAGTPLRATHDQPPADVSASDCTDGSCGATVETTTAPPQPWTPRCSRASTPRWARSSAASSTTPPSMRRSARWPTPPASRLGLAPVAARQRHRPLPRRRGRGCPPGHPQPERAATRRGTVITIERPTASTGGREHVNVNAIVQRVEHAVQRAMDRQASRAEHDAGGRSTPRPTRPRTPATTRSTVT